MNTISKCLTALALIAWSGLALAQTYSIIELPTLGGDTFGYAVNDSGQVTGYSYLSPSGTGSDPRHAYLYSNGVMQDLGTLPGFTSSSGFGINISGEVTGSSLNSGTDQHAFLYSA
jgi:probable HAF family extracellular repeat protein